MENILNRLKILINGHDLYMAGLPRFARNFTRDSIIASILMQNAHMLKSQLVFCAELQGKVKNPLTGEEPGKIHHEFPTVSETKLTTQYNACDATALFLIGHEIYQKLTADKKLAHSQRENIEKAVIYIKKHLKNNAFNESPQFSTAKTFKLKTTYWKDSEFFGRRNGKPAYPVIYTLAHIQNMAALKSADLLLKDKSLNEIATKMSEFFRQKLFDQNTGTFYVAIDRKGPVDPINSDQLHSLFYLDEKDVTPQMVSQMIDNSKELETEAGFRTMSKECAMLVKDKYHAITVWPFEQAIINIAARKHKVWADKKNLKELSKKLLNVVKISSRVIRFLSIYPEILVMGRNGKVFETVGCHPQLWTIAAAQYFNSSSENHFI